MELTSSGGPNEPKAYNVHRIFTGMGETVAEHVRRLRPERGALLLKHGQAPVTSLALKAG